MPQLSRADAQRGMPEQRASANVCLRPWVWPHACQRMAAASGSCHISAGVAAVNGSSHMLAMLDTAILPPLTSLAAIVAVLWPSPAKSHSTHLRRCPGMLSTLCSPHYALESLPPRPSLPQQLVMLCCTVKHASVACCVGTYYVVRAHVAYRVRAHVAFLVAERTKTLGQGQLMRWAWPRWKALKACAHVCFKLVLMPSVGLGLGPKTGLYMWQRPTRCLVPSVWLRSTQGIPLLGPCN
eukprot:356357-Chlamydomonas_euryale.AAC.4